MWEWETPSCYLVHSCGDVMSNRKTGCLWALSPRPGRRCTCRWLATFSLVKPSTFIWSRILLGTASAFTKRVTQHVAHRLNFVSNIRSLLKPVPCPRKDGALLSARIL